MNRILQNLRDARAIIAAAPDEQINLEVFGVKKHCGTLYCAAGWLTTSDRFKEHMHLKWGDLPLGEDGNPHSQRIASATLVSPSGDGYLGKWLDELFGPDAYNSLFSYRFGGLWDRSILNQRPHLSDRDLALARFDMQILKLGYYL